MITRISFDIFPPFRKEKGLDFSLDSNFRYVYGSNGCGKSSLFRGIDTMLNMTLYNINFLRNCKGIKAITNGENLVYSFDKAVIHHKKYFWDEEVENHIVRNITTGEEVTRSVNTSYQDDEFNNLKKKKKTDIDNTTERKCWWIAHTNYYDGRETTLKETKEIVKQSTVGNMVCNLYNAILLGCGGLLHYHHGKCLLSHTWDVDNEGMDIEFMSFGCWKIFMLLCRICDAIVNKRETVFLLDDFEFVLTKDVFGRLIHILQFLCKTYTHIQIIVSGYEELPSDIVPESKQFHLVLR